MPEDLEDLTEAIESFGRQVAKHRLTAQVDQIDESTQEIALFLDGNESEPVGSVTLFA